MPDSCPCETLWTTNPAALFDTNLLVNDVCESNNINAFTRAFLVGLVGVGLMWPYLGIGGLLVLSVALIAIYGRWLFAKVIPETKTVVVDVPVAEKKEGYADMGADIRPDMRPVLAFPTIATSPAATIVTRPTTGNPFMNVLIDEIMFNPTRGPAQSATDPRNQVILDDYFRIQWSSDPTDVFGRSQSQRQFYTMPSTSIPNDQGSFQNWLYLIPGKTCKEGGRDACYPGTNGAPVTWLNQPN